MRPFEISEALYPFESKFMTIEGMRVHYIDEGSGHPIVFCHGNPSWSLLYAPMIRELRAHFRCIAVDYPGFGMSEKPSLDQYGFLPDEHSRILGAAVDELIPAGEKFSVFVQDWGGPIGLNMAADRADRVHKLYIGNTWAWAADLNTPEGQGMKAFSDKMGGDAMREKILKKNLFVNMSMGQLTHGFKRHSPELAKELKAAYLAPFADSEESRMGTAVFPRQIAQSHDWLAALDQKVAAKLEDKPTLLFWGEQDPLFSSAIREIWEGRLKDSKTVLLPEAAHFFQQDAPDEIVKAMIDFG
ncbi:MAG: alpha/beta fold hydrolase [bacterium]|nr:alpha/beta fold hydrolase [bacterium]